MTKTEPKDAEPSFEQSLEKLEGIVHELEDGNVDLEASLARYEQGVKLLRQCYQILENAERRIEILKSVDENGQPVVEPMDDEDLSLDDKEKQRSKRRSSRVKGKKKRKRKSVERDSAPETEMSESGMPDTDMPDTDMPDTDMDVPGELF